MVTNKRAWAIAASCLLAAAGLQACTAQTGTGGLTSSAAVPASSSTGGGTSSGANATSSAGAVAPLMLNLSGHDVGPGELDDFVDAVTRLSGGSIKVNVVENVHGDDINYEQEYIEDAKAGRFDLVEVGARAWDLVGVNGFRPMVAPFLIDNYGLEQAVIASPAADTALASVAPQGLVGIALIPGEMRHPVGVKHAILTPADLQGQRVGIRPSHVAEQTFQALGANAEGYPPGGDLSALDAIEQDLFRVAGNQYDQSTTATTTNLNLWPRMQTVVMNGAAYATLTPDQQQLLHRAALESSTAKITRIKTQESQAVTQLCRAGYHLVQVTPADLTAFENAVQPVISGFTADPAEAAEVTAIRALATTTPTDNDGTPTCAGHPTTATALDGT